MTARSTTRRRTSARPTRRVNNDLDTDVGDTLQNSATAYFTNGDTGTQESINDTTAAVLAIEPSLTATKAIANVTGRQAAERSDRASVTSVQYVLTVTEPRQRDRA